MNKLQVLQLQEEFKRVELDKCSNSDEVLKVEQFTTAQKWVDYLCNIDNNKTALGYDKKHPIEYYLTKLSNNVIEAMKKCTSIGNMHGSSKETHFLKRSNYI